MRSKQGQKKQIPGNELKTLKVIRNIGQHLTGGEQTDTAQLMRTVN